MAGAAVPLSSFWFRMLRDTSERTARKSLVEDLGRGPAGAVFSRPVRANRPTRSLRQSEVRLGFRSVSRQVGSNPVFAHCPDRTSRGTNPRSGSQLGFDECIGLNAIAERHFRETVHLPPLAVNQPGTTVTAELQWHASAKRLAALTLRKPMG